MEEITKKKLQAIACKVRMGVIEGTYCAKSGHPGGSLSISDLLTYLYSAKMQQTMQSKTQRSPASHKNPGTQFPHREK